MDEVTKLKIQNLINKRQMSIQMFALTISGFIGLLFVPASALVVTLLVIGGYYNLLLLKNYVYLDMKIDKLIKSLEDNK